MHEFIIHKSNGQLSNTKKLKQFLEDAEDGRYLVKIQSYNKRSLSQNAWIHAVLPDILQGLRDVGYNEIRTTEDAKDFIKSMFFKKTVTNGIDEVTIIEGTSAQSKINFAEKATDIIQWCAEYLGIDVAPPETQLTVFKD